MPRILIADDDRDLLSLFLQALNGYEVEGAHSGYCALEKYANSKCLGKPFDLMIFDVAMTDMTGFQLEEAIRATGDSTARIVFLSGHFGGSAQEEVFKANVARSVGVWRKPIEVPQFLAAVEAALG